MSVFEKVIHKLNEDVPIPEDIKVNIKTTISELPEKTDSRIEPNNVWKKAMIKVAAVTGCILVTSSTIYSVAAYSGIADYLKKVWNRELSAKEMALVENDVEQKVSLEETEVTPNIAFDFNDYADVKISEALCDNGQCIVDMNVFGESTNHEFVSSQLEFKLCDRSRATTYVYVPEYKQEVEDSNTVIDKVVITKTELGLKCVTYYHLAEENAEDEKINFGTFIWILDEGGNRLEHNEGSAGGGSSKLTTISTQENSITWTDYYTNIEMPDMLLIQPHNIVNEELYEPIEVYLNQTK